MNEGRLRNLLVATTVGTYVLLLLGIYTAAMGAGLTCDARWPLCDGAVFGLFPANWPSFIEWFHRLVAMIVGFMIIGSAYGVWRSGVGRRSLAAMGVAVLLLPVQIWLGAETVLTYTILALTAHFVTALVIFAAITLATLWTIGPGVVRLDRIRFVLAAALVLHVPFAVLAPRVLFDHTGRVQFAYYGVGLLIFTGLVIATAWSGSLQRAVPTLGRVQLLAGLGTVLVGAQLLAGRLVYTSTIQTADVVATVATVVLLAVAIWLTYRTDAPGATRSGDVAGN